MKCGITRKVMFKSHTAAALRAGEILTGGATQARELRAYKCDFCGGWHLTKAPQAKVRLDAFNKKSDN